MKSKYQGLIISLSAKLLKGVRRVWCCSIEKYDLIIFKPDGFGDFLLAKATIDILLKHTGAQRVLLIVSHYSEGIAKWCYPDLTIYPVDARQPFIKGACRLLTRDRGLLGLQADTLVSLRTHASGAQQLILKMISAERVHELRAPECIAPSSHEYDKSVVTTGMRLNTILDSLKELLIEFTGEEWEGSAVLPALRPPEQVDVPAMSYALVSPFAKDRIKDMTAEQMRVVLDEFEERGVAWKVSVVQSREKDARALLAACGRADSAEKIELAPDFSAYIVSVAQAALVVSADTGTAHLSQAFDLPTLVLLGGGHYGVFGLWGRGSHHVWLSKPLACYNCRWECIHSEPLCLTTLNLETLKGELVRLIKDSSLGALKYNKGRAH